MEVIEKIKRNLDRVQTIINARGGNIVSTIKYIYKMLRLRKFNLLELHDFEFEKFPEEYTETFLNWTYQKKYLELLNPRKYFSIARNKYWTHLYFDQMGIKDKATLYCYYDPETRVCNGTVTSNLNSTLETLRTKHVNKCGIKTTESSHGDNVIVAKSIVYKDTDAEITKFNDETIMLSDVLQKTPLLFESHIVQTEQLSRLNPSSVNTVRFMTNLMPNGNAKTIAAFIKIGRSGYCVDNAGAGGNVDACVDIETGEIKYAIQFDGWRKIKDIDCHPDTGEQLNGIVIENWNEIKKKVESFQASLPFVKAAGWDIAITEDGPVIIEVNDMWDRTGQLFIRKGWKPEIEECYKQWKKYYSNGK